MVWIDAAQTLKHLLQGLKCLWIFTKNYCPRMSSLLIALLCLVYVSNGIGSDCNYIQLNDGQTWYFAANECMQYQMNNITRSHIYECIPNQQTIQYKIYDSSDSCQGNDYDIAAIYTSKNTFSMNCGASLSATNCSLNWNIYFLHGQCNTNNLNINDYQFNTIIQNQCVKYNSSNLQSQQLNRNRYNSIEAASYRSTIWSCNSKKELVQNTYLSEDCSGASTNKVYTGCTSDNYKYFAACS